MVHEVSEPPPAREKEAFSEDMWGTHTKLEKAPAEKWVEGMLNIWDAPVKWIRERIVLPMRPAHPPKYYHQRFNRVPTVEECYMDDVVCIFEAHEQYKRDRKVDAKIVEVLRSRWHHCMRYHGFDQAERCEAMRQEFQDTETNWFIKYGDVCMYTNCAAAYYKQVHRLIWERRQAEKAAKRAAEQQ